jgi:hypothetical protein
LVADLLGIVDPSPVSDGISGAIAVKKGDFLGTGLSLLAMFPGGDAAKPAKVVRQLLDRFPALRRIISSADDFPRLLRLLKHVLKDPGAMKKLEESVKAGDLKGMLQGAGQLATRVNLALSAVNALQKRAEKAYAAARPDLLEELRKRKLPMDGPIVFVPKKRMDPNQLRRSGPGIKDAFGQLWRWDAVKEEWDVSDVTE